MALVVDVPLSTAIADLDDALRRLLKRDLERHGFDGVDVVFDAPSREWSGKLTRPTVDLFLYDLREASDRAELTPTETRANGIARVSPPPLPLELTYAVTAWTNAVEDEHRLLSQVLAILFSYPRLPEALLEGEPSDSALRRVETSVGRPREEKADFWTSVGGQYKVSLDFLARLVLQSGASVVRGPEVRVQTVRTSLSGRPESTMRELHRIGGKVSGSGGEPIAGAWVALPELGRWSESDADGRFSFDRLVAGQHQLLVRTADGHEMKATISVPGDQIDLEIGDGKRESAATHRRRRS